jgi:hypothetical protein
MLIVIIGFLFLSVKIAFSLDKTCLITSDIKDCSNCVGDEKGFCQPGSYDCADSFFIDWVEKDVCDWTKGIWVCDSTIDIFDPLYSSTALSHSTVNLCGLKPYEIILGEGESLKVMIGVKEYIVSVDDVYNSKEGFVNVFGSSASRSPNVKVQVGKSYNINGVDLDVKEIYYNLDYPPKNRMKLILYHYKGDLNSDLKVNILDIFIVARAFGYKPGDQNWNPIADINGDGVVNIIDVYILAKNFGKDYSIPVTGGFIGSMLKTFNIIVILITLIILVFFFGLLKILKGDKSKKKR